MNAYIDSSVLLRILHNEPGKLAIWPKIQRAVSSELIQLESLRTIDRERIRLQIDDDVVARRRAALLEALDAFDLVAIERPVLDRAEQPFPTMLGSLGAIHLATALLVREQFSGLSFTTHDDLLARAATSVGFAVYGV